MRTQNTVDNANCAQRAAAQSGGIRALGTAAGRSRRPMLFVIMAACLLRACQEVKFTIPHCDSEVKSCSSIRHELHVCLT